MDEKTTVTEIFKIIAQRMCDEYCKWPPVQYSRVVSRHGTASHVRYGSSLVKNRLVKAWLSKFGIELYRVVAA